MLDDWNTENLGTITLDDNVQAYIDTVGKSITILLAAPMLSSVSVNSDFSVTVEWDRVSAAAQYRVFYKTNTGKWTKIADTDSTSYTWKDSEAGTTYAFTVRCLTEDGRYYASAYDEIGKSVTTPLAAIATPQLSSVTANSASSVTVKWSPVSGAAKYRVYYKTDSEKWTKIADTDSTSYTWTGAEADTNYTFMVRCLSSDGKDFTSAYDKAGMSVTTPAA